MATQGHSLEMSHKMRGNKERRGEAPGGVLWILTDRNVRRILNFDSGIFLGKENLVSIGLSGDFFGYSKQSEVCW